MNKKIKSTGFGDSIKVAVKLLENYKLNKDYLGFYYLVDMYKLLTSDTSLQDYPMKMWYGILAERHGVKPKAVQFDIWYVLQGSGYTAKKFILKLIDD